MGWFSKFLSRRQPIRGEDLAKPFVKKAHDALRKEELNKAIAYLDRGLELVPGDLNLHLQKAQIYQYGLNDFSKALEGYRYILIELDARPDSEMEAKCRAGMADMMRPTQE